MNDIELFLKNYLKEIYISIERVEFTHCSTNWKSSNYTPLFSSIGFICDGEVKWH